MKIYICIGGLMLKKCTTFFAWVILLSTTLSTLFLVTNIVTAGPVDPEVELTLDQTIIMADVSKVSPDNPCIVKFTGYVSVSFNPSTSIIVDLTVTDTWQLAILAPTSMQFSSDSPNDKEFTVEIEIPYIIDSDEVDEITIFGSWTLYPSTKQESIDPVVGKVMVEKYHNFWLDLQHTKTREVRPGSDTSISFSILNMGNGEETFIVTVQNLDELKARGFDCESTYYIHVLPDEETGCSILIKTPKDLVEDKLYDINIEIKPMDDRGNDVPIKNVTFHIKVQHGTSRQYYFNFCYLPIILVIAIPIFLVFYYKWKRLQKMKNGKL
jgi:hypothetical protein